MQDVCLFSRQARSQPSRVPVKTVMSVYQHKYTLVNAGYLPVLLVCSQLHGAPVKTVMSVSFVGPSVHLKQLESQEMDFHEI
jgi:hypothetical protein